MAKFYGKIGFGITQKTSLDVWEPEEIVERNYKGDVARLQERFNVNEYSVNDNLNVDNEISIVADPFAYDHISNIRYVEFMGSLWKVKTVAIRYPRLVMWIGGVYNGPTPRVEG